MRYLKVYAQDRSGNGHANVVKLRFYKKSACGRAVLLNKAIAVDFSRDGKVDHREGDVTNNGIFDACDDALLSRFANTYLKLNWFNDRDASSRYMHVFAKGVYTDGMPDTVFLHMHEGTDEASRKTLVAWSAVCDVDNNGRPDWNIYSDVNRDGVVNDSDLIIVQQLADMFLKFNWYTPGTGFV
ncbi:hypothetical protein QF043_006128 [Pseudomonas sp. W3I7]|uniref:hypothetical protein n=1 Tax=Pseudomonas sp. W3I7 TaxID=3042292 RepID=UPI0027911AE7|nr:hypothetical protein [Pseudomonas sp. W3I7]MDQ0707336.1 hypothetical protein [Pseudomonas sp. W3I7]